MPYCYECGSQVAKNDVFCPYCGISLKPIAVESLQNDEDFTNTIAVNSSEMPFRPSESATEPSAAENSDNIETIENRGTHLSGNDGITKTEENISSQPSGNSLTPITENPERKTELADIPNDIFGNQSANQETSSASNEFFDDENKSSKDSYASRQKENDGAENTFNRFSADAGNAEGDKAAKIELIKPLDENSPLQAKKIGDQQANAEFNAADSESGTIQESFSNPDSSLEEASNKEIEQPFSSPIENFPDIPPALRANDEQPEQKFSENSALSDLSEKENQESGQISQKQDFSDLPSPIEKPNVELPAVQSSAAVFDSVQIVQKEEKRDPFQSHENQPKFKPEQEKESRSYTSPNINAGSNTDGKSSSKLKPLQEGTILNGRYEIVRKIGGGGMGAVYLASDKNLGGVLRAVKEMIQSYIEETQQEKAVSDFKRESMLLTSLDHPAIPTIYDYFYDEKAARFYLVMKYISGGDLASHLRSSSEGKIDEKTVTEWAIQIVDVLDYLHNRQPPIVYRDLKPTNIMIDGNTGRVMLIDFGIARWVNKEEKGVTAVGTMGYAPPELFSGNVEPRSDIYSLGSTMFHLLTGADPQSNPLLIFDFQKNPSPRQINPQLSDQMERILMRAVEYNAQKRFSSAAEMRQVLEEHLQNLKAGKVTFGVKQTPHSLALSEESVFCGFCGQKIIATDMFCAFCGAKQPIAQQGVHFSEARKTPHQTAKLIIIGTSELESPTFSLEKESNLVGRRDPMSNIFPEVDLSKFDPQTKISRRHARIWREGNNYMVEDLGSSNGTILQPVLSQTLRLAPHQPHILSNGDKLKLGDTTMHFVVG